MNQRNNIQYISVDLQHDFASKGGKYYCSSRPVIFLKEAVFPYLRENNVYICEILSDYRHPRPMNRKESCVPGTWGFESIVPDDIIKARWIKSMNSPIWIRDNIGNPNKAPSLPYQDTKLFNKWLDRNIGKPQDTTIILFGLTIDCCVLCVAQELSWRGYDVMVLKEGVGYSSANEKAKEVVLKSVIGNWAKVVTWSDVIEANVI